MSLKDTLAYRAIFAASKLMQTRSMCNSGDVLYVNDNKNIGFLTLFCLTGDIEINRCHY